MSINFIQDHIIDRIRKETESILKSEKNTGFIWLEQPIYDKNNFNINKIGKSSPFGLKLLSHLIGMPYNQKHY